MKGQVFAFGDNNYYQLGDQIVNNLAQPKLIENSDLFINEGFISIACGANHNLLLNENGSVFTFGINNVGQLGILTPLDIYAIPQQEL